ncbi:MAG TPA: hypothetical protein VFG38_17325, partial [Pseudomonadales bacterium]|nr:hypothetical protein [Pseudomonadales bacterium]
LSDRIVSVAPLMLTACGGFLLAVLWMDLLFDVQVLKNRTGDLPEDVLASIAAYYRRVTTTSRPMGRLVALVMATTLVTLAVELVNGAPVVPVLASFALGGAPIVGAVAKTFRDAARLGARGDDVATQSRLARSIYREHVAYVVGIAAFIGLQIASAVAEA